LKTLKVFRKQKLPKVHQNQVNHFYSWKISMWKPKQINYDKGDSGWTIELSTTTKVTTILAFDSLVKLHFLWKDTIHSFSLHILQPFATTTIVFVIIRMPSEIDSKFELLVANGSSPKDIQIVSFWKSSFF
jgi:hypothetical protein